MLDRVLAEVDVSRRVGPVLPSVAQPGGSQFFGTALAGITADVKGVQVLRPVVVDGHARVIGQRRKLDDSDVRVGGLKSRDRTYAVVQRPGRTGRGDFDRRLPVALPAHGRRALASSHVRTGNDDPRRHEETGSALFANDLNGAVAYQALDLTSH
jgi:hypothetical protein